MPLLGVCNEREHLVTFKRQFKASVTHKCNYTLPADIFMHVITARVPEQGVCIYVCVPFSVVQLCVGRCVGLPAWEGAWTPCMCPF